MTEEPRTPLTLEYAPEGVENDYESKPIIVIEPSFQEPGRIFVGINPVGKRIGVHLLPEDAERVRAHLSKLLMEEDEAPVSPNWSERIEAAAKRAQSRPKRKLPKLPRLLFCFEFRIGNVEGVVGRVNNGPR